MAVSESQRRANQNQDATRKGRKVLWLEDEDNEELERLRRIHKHPSRIATLRWLMAGAPRKRAAGGGKT